MLRGCCPKPVTSSPLRGLWTWLLVGALGSAVGASPARADEILLPDFTPATLEDFALADDLTNLARMAFEDRGFAVLSGEDLTDRVGDAADACADDVACPVSLWPMVSARTAVVGRVGRAGSLIHIRVLVYADRGSRASRVLDERVAPAEAGELLLLLADDLAPEEAPPPEVQRASGGVVEERYSPIDSSDSGRASPEERKSAARPGSSAPLDGYSSQELERLDLPRYALRRFEESGQEPEDWLEAARVRRPAVLVELRGGAVFGDLDRRFDARVGLYDESGNAWSERNLYTYQSFLNSSGFAGGLALGYQPTWWVDVSILAGVQLGQKELTTGWETWEAGGNLDGTDLFLDSDEVSYDPVSAIMATLEPRVRLFPLATGVLKPYALAGLNLRFYDGFKVPDLDFVDYPEANGGVGLGPTIGAGLAFDAPRGTYGFVELPWTWVVSPTGPQIVDDGLLEQTPAQFKGVGQFLVISAGVGFHLR